MIIPGVLSISDFLLKYKIKSESAKTDLITMQAFFQFVGMGIGMVIATVALYFIWG